MAAPRTAMLVVVGLLLPVPAAAQVKTYCSEPVTPFCTNRTTVFEDDAARDRCRDDVASYVEGMREYVDCLNQQQEEARERARQIEERFACMARGGEDCP